MWFGMDESGKEDLARGRGSEKYVAVGVGEGRGGEGAGAGASGWGERLGRCWEWLAVG